MSVSNDDSRIKSSAFEAAILQPILLNCMNGISIYNLAASIQKTIPIPYCTVKKYLFDMIEYDLLFYNGQNQMFTTDKAGYDLLVMIERKKALEKLDMNDIIIEID